MRKQLSAICLNPVSNFELNLTDKKKEHLSFCPRKILIEPYILRFKLSKKLSVIGCLIIIIMYEEQWVKF